MQLVRFAGSQDEPLAGWLHVPPGTAQGALDLDPDSAYAYAVMGLVHFADNNMPLAEPALRKAIELNPGFAEAYAWLGLVYMDQGRIEEALEIHKTSALLSPLSSTAPPLPPMHCWSGAAPAPR